jgi:glucose/mannose transport system substrate-binding protein
MTGSDGDSGLSRRRVLQSAGVAAAAGLAGCGGGGSSEQAPIELLHAWSSGDGSAAIEALIGGFQEAHPDVEFAEEPVNGAARSNLDQVVQNRLQANDPPSTFQTWPGKTLEKFGDAYADIEGDVWDQDMKDNYLEGPQTQAQLDGTYVTVPLNIHRINNLFYNQNVLDDAGVDPTSMSSYSDVVDACATVAEETDAVPFADQRRVVDGPAVGDHPAGRGRHQRLRGLHRGRGRPGTGRGSPAVGRRPLGVLPGGRLLD